MGMFSKIAGNFVKDRVSNTKTAFQLIIDDFKKYVIILKWVFLAFSSATLIYSIVTGTGNLIINCCLLGLLVIYSVLDTILRKRINPNVSKKIHKFYVWAKIVLNGAALGSSLYSLYSATASDVKPISIVLATLSMIMFILKVLLEIVFEIFASKWELLKSGMMMDAQEFPGTAGKLFAPITGDVEQGKVKESIVKRITNKQNR